MARRTLDLSTDTRCRTARTRTARRRRPTWIGDGRTWRSSLGHVGGVPVRPERRGRHGGAETAGRSRWGRFRAKWPPRTWTATASLELVAADTRGRGGRVSKGSGDGGVGDAPRVAHRPGRDHRGRGRRRRRMEVVGRHVLGRGGARAERGRPARPRSRRSRSYTRRTRDESPVLLDEVCGAACPHPTRSRRAKSAARPGGLIPGGDLVRRVRVRDRRRARVRTTCWTSGRRLTRCLSSTTSPATERTI